MNAAATVAEPRSRPPPSCLPRLKCGNRCRSQSEPRQEPGLRSDTRDHEISLAAHLNRRVGRPDAPSRTDRADLITPGHQPRGLTRGVDTSHLGRHRGDTADRKRENSDQRSNRQRGFDGAEPAIGQFPLTDQTLVASARLMMLVSALTIESPVTTLYRIAPNAAAAMVPTAYSTKYG